MWLSAGTRSHKDELGELDDDEADAWDNDEDDIDLEELKQVERDAKRKMAEERRHRQEAEREQKRKAGLVCWFPLLPTSSDSRHTPYTIKPSINICEQQSSAAHHKAGTDATHTM